MITCPSCNKNGFFDISEDIVKQSARGIVALNLNNQICSHNFIAYVDKNLMVRDCFLTDFEIELPEIDTKQENKSIPSADILNVSLIKLDLYPKTISFVIRGCFFKKKILFLSEAYLVNHIKEFFSYIFRDSFEIDITVLLKDEYVKDKKKNKDLLIFEDNSIIQDKNKILDLKKLKVEKNFVHKFFTELIPNPSLIILRNEIYKANLLSQTIIQFIKKLKKTEKIDATRLIKEFDTIHNIKIGTPYLDFLVGIVENYHKIDVPVISKNILGFL